MSFLDLFRKGGLPERAYVTLEELPVDEVSPDEDGDNTELHVQFGHLITPEQIAAHEAEVAE